MITEVLAPTTLAAYSQQFSTAGGSFNITCIGLATDETATLRFYDSISSTWNNLQRYGQPYALMSAGNNNINVVLENGRYCMYKTASESAAGIGIESQPFSVIFTDQVGA
jgi:hypothetical protein